MDRIISSLKPGQSARISGNSLVWVTVERSGNGKVVRFVRHCAAGSHVFKVIQA